MKAGESALTFVLSGFAVCNSMQILLYGADVRCTHWFLVVVFQFFSRL